MDLSAEFACLLASTDAAAQELRRLLLDPQLPNELWNAINARNHPDPTAHTRRTLATLDDVLAQLNFVDARLRAISLTPPPPHDIGNPDSATIHPAETATP